MAQGDRDAKGKTFDGDGLSIFGRTLSGRDSESHSTDQAWIKTVLLRNGCEDPNDDAVSLIVSSLGWAESDTNPQSLVYRVDQEREKEGKRKLELLDELIQYYRDELAVFVDPDDPSTPSPHVNPDFHAALGPVIQEKNEKVQYLEELRSAEQNALEKRNTTQATPYRPESPKNFTARKIFETLRDELGLKCWNACRIIAEIFLEAGIEERPKEKVQRSLYDKLRRI